MKKTITKMVKLSLVGSLVLSAFAIAQQKEPRQPPKEAIEACLDQSENAQVSITTPRGDTIGASCKLINDQLIAVPLNPPNRNKDRQKN